MPQGPAWDDGIELDLLYRALTGDGAQVHGDADQFIVDFLPDTSTAFLADWERVLGLLPGVLSDADRRAQIVTRLRGFGDPTLANVQGAADAWGNGAVVTDHDYPLFRMGLSSMGDALRGDRWVSTVTITYNGPASPAFEAAMRARVPLTVVIIFVVI